MKYKLSTFTHQDSLARVIVHVRNVFLKDRAKPFPGTEDPYGDAVKKMEALPKPLHAKDLRRIFKEGGFPEGWWKGEHWRPVCGLCEELVDWLLVIEDVFGCEDSYNDTTFDLEICSQCVARLGSEVLKHEQA